MHCQICDTLLTDFEATRRIKDTRVYLDLCNACFKSIDTHLPIVERKDLMLSGDFDDDLSTEGSIENYNVFNDYIVHNNINE